MLLQSSTFTIFAIFSNLKPKNYDKESSYYQHFNSCDVKL